MYNISETYGIISFSSIFEGFINSVSAKFATIWFDNLLFEDYWNSPNVSIPGTEDWSFSDWVEGKLQAQGAKPDTIKYLQERWRGIFDARQEHDLMLGPHNSLPAKIERIIEETVNREVTQPLISDRVHEIDVDKESSAAIRNTTRMVSRAIFAPPDTSIVSGQLTRKTLAAISTSLARTPSDVAHIMLHSQVPDFSELSWENVIELCHHSHYDVFRSRMSEMQDLRNVGAIEEAAKLCNDIFTHSLKKLVQATRTKCTVNNVVEGIIGNTTLLGWVFSARDAAAQKRINSAHGWIYFVLDLEKAVHQKKI